MRTLSTAVIAEINKIATDSADLVLLEIGLTPAIYLVSNNEDVTWNSKTWQAFPFELDTVGETGKGEISAVVVRVSNITGEIQALLEAADGANGTAVTIRVINTTASTSTEAEFEMAFVVESSSYDQQWITFRLTGANCLTRRIPRRRYLKNFCPFAYGGIECGVSAATVSSYPTCSRTWDDCTTRGNSSRFGGFRWMPDL